MSPVTDQFNISENNKLYVPIVRSLRSKGLTFLIITALYSSL
jgi:hypothetical protein